MAASTNLCGLANVKIYLGVSETTYNYLLNLLIAAVSEATEKYCNREFASASHVEYHDGLGLDYIMVKNPPITAIASLYDDPNREYNADNLLDADDAYIYYGDEGRVQLVNGRIFYDGSKNVKVTYTGGYSAIPDDVEQAAIHLTAKLFNISRKRADGLASESLGSYSYSLASTRNLIIGDGLVETLLGAYRIPAIGV